MLIQGMKSSLPCATNSIQIIAPYDSLEQVGALAGGMHGLQVTANAHADDLKRCRNHSGLQRE